MPGGPYLFYTVDRSERKRCNECYNALTNKYRLYNEGLLYRHNRRVNWTSIYMSIQHLPSVSESKRPLPRLLRLYPTIAALHEALEGRGVVVYCHNTDEGLYKHAAARSKWRYARTLCWVRHEEVDIRCACSRWFECTCECE